MFSIPSLFSVLYRHFLGDVKCFHVTVRHTKVVTVIFLATEMVFTSRQGRDSLLLATDKAFTSSLLIVMAAVVVSGH